LTLEEKLKLLPEKPGVYLMKDAKEKIIYVGKAISLRRRVRSYFQASHQKDSKVKALVSHIADLEYIVTDSELEALILECNLIKEHRPKYNINLKDSKGYPYLKLTWQENFPRLFIAHEMYKDGSRYFGPYTNGQAVHSTRKLLKKIFPLRTCKKMIKENSQERPCLNFHLQQCLAPCAGKVSEEEYRQVVKEVALFLEGRQETVVRNLLDKMEEHADKLEFEKAAAYRDKIQAVQKVVERQKIVSDSTEDEDVLGMALADDLACVQVFFIRSGKLIGREHFFLEGIEEKNSEEVLEAFIEQYYSKATFLPAKISLPIQSANNILLEEWLSRQKGKKVSLKFPKRGAKKELVQMVEKNAQLVLQEEILRTARERERTLGAVADLQKYLFLDKIPYRIEAFDISNIQGIQAVGSMVVFVGGKEKKRRLSFL